MYAVMPKKPKKTFHSFPSGTKAAVYRGLADSLEGKTKYLGSFAKKSAKRACDGSRLCEALKALKPEGNKPVTPVPHQNYYLSDLSLPPSGLIDVTSDLPQEPTVEVEIVKSPAGHQVLYVHYQGKTFLRMCRANFVVTDRRPKKSRKELLQTWKDLGELESRNPGLTGMPPLKKKSTVAKAIDRLVSKADQRRARSDRKKYGLT